MGFFSKLFGGGKAKDRDLFDESFDAAVHELENEYDEIFEQSAAGRQSLDAELVFKAVGNMDDRCPYCDSELSKRPGRKAKCPHCGDSIYVRKRPNSEDRALMTEAQTLINDSQLAVINWNNTDRMDSNRIIDLFDHQEILKKKFGFQPKLNDILWSMHNNNNQAFFSEKQYSKLRFSHQEMAQQLIAEGKLEPSLRHIFMVFLIDLSGYHDILLDEYGEVDEDFKDNFELWSSKVEGHIIGLIIGVVEAEQIDKDPLEARFRDAIMPYADHFNVDPNEAWDKVCAEVFSDS